MIKSEERVVCGIPMYSQLVNQSFLRPELEIGT
jgi:hypothetical protein